MRYAPRVKFEKIPAVAGGRVGASARIGGDCFPYERKSGCQAAELHVILGMLGLSLHALEYDVDALVDGCPGNIYELHDGAVEADLRDGFRADAIAFHFFNLDDVHVEGFTVISAHGAYAYAHVPVCAIGNPRDFKSEWGGRWASDDELRCFIHAGDHLEADDPVHRNGFLVQPFQKPWGENAVVQEFPDGRGTQFVGADGRIGYKNQLSPVVFIPVFDVQSDVLELSGLIYGVLWRREMVRYPFRVFLVGQSRLDCPFLVSGFELVPRKPVANPLPRISAVGDFGLPAMGQ